MASDKALVLHEKFEKNLKIKSLQLKPFTELEKGLLFGGKPGKDGVEGMTLTNFPKTEAYLGVNENAPVWVEGKATKLDPDLKASLWMPIHDRPPFPGCEWLDVCVNFICFCRDQNWSIYIHCSAGLSRSAMVMAAYYMKTEGLTPEKALNKLLIKRPINPNPSFIDGLFEYEKWLKKH